MRFWAAIARGVSSEDAACEAGVSPAVGVRWFREGGGMPPVTLAPLSGRYLSFAEREEIAILRAQRVWGAGDRASARSFAVDDLAGAAAQRRDSRRPVWSIGPSTAQWHADRRGAAPEAGEAGRQRASCGGMCRTASSGAVQRPDGRRCARVLRCGGSAGVTAGARTGAGRSRGARSRSPTGCGWTSPMMSRCGSRTRRSTSRSMCRAAARCDAS